MNPNRGFLTFMAHDSIFRFRNSNDPSFHVVSLNMAYIYILFSGARVELFYLKIYETCESQKSFVTPSVTPQKALTPKLLYCVFSQTVSQVYCYIHSQPSDVWAKITDDHVDEAGAVTIPVHLCDCWHGEPHFSICLSFTDSN